MCEDSEAIEAHEPNAEGKNAEGDVTLDKGGGLMEAAGRGDVTQTALELRDILVVLDEENGEEVPYTHTHTQTHTHTYTHTHMHACTHARMHAGTSTRAHRLIYVRMDAWRSGWMHACKTPSTHTHQAAEKPYQWPPMALGTAECSAESEQRLWGGLSIPPP